MRLKGDGTIPQQSLQVCSAASGEEVTPHCAVSVMMCFTLSLLQPHRLHKRLLAPLTVKNYHSLCAAKACQGRALSLTTDCVYSRWCCCASWPSCIALSARHGSPFVTPRAARIWICVLQALGLDGEAKGDGQATYLMYAASFLDKVYPGRGMSSSLRMEHIKNMGASDFYKVWKARRPRPASLPLAVAAAQSCGSGPASEMAINPNT